MSGQLSMTEIPAFDWAKRLNNKTDCEWVLDHPGDYPQEARDAARSFLDRYPSMLAGELAHNFKFVIEGHHRKLGDPSNPRVAGGERS